MLKMANFTGYMFLSGAIISTVCSQLITKWRVENYITSLLPMPNEFFGRICFLFKVIFDPFIFLAMCLTFLGGLLWLATMTKFDISFAYPLTMLGFVAVLILSHFLLGESFNIYKIIGCIVIIMGVIITSRGL